MGWRLRTTVFALDRMVFLGEARSSSEANPAKG